MIIPDYKHQMGAHCESGTIASLLRYHDLNISEPLVFGIAGGIFFAYFHKTRSFSFPTFILRNKPGEIRKNLAKRLNVGFQTYHFRDIGKGFSVLDSLIGQQIPVACQVDFFYLDYVPSWERVHINVHFLVVIGKEENRYIISDAYFPEIVSVQKSSLEKGRFPGGNMSPDGFLFHITRTPPPETDLAPAIIKGIRKAAFNMLKIPIPFLGIKGMRLMARKLPEWPKFARDTEHLSHEIMKINILLEDQGTGGAGFRYMYATFLQQAAAITGIAALKGLSEELMIIGDGWREISLFAARIGKNRDLGPEKLRHLGEMISRMADAEERFFRSLSKTV